MGSYTQIPDAAWVHMQEWQLREMRGHAWVYCSAAKGAALGWVLNAKRLVELAGRFSLPVLPSLRRSQLILRELIAWGFLAWENPGALQQRYGSKLLLAGRDYELKQTSFAYLDERKLSVRAVKAKERAEARRRRDEASPGQSGTRSKAKSPHNPWRAVYERHEALLRAAFAPHVDAKELQQLPDVWTFVARAFEQKGFHPGCASKYLSICAKASDLKGAKSRLLIAKSKDRLQNYIGENRSKLTVLPMQI